MSVGDLEGLHSSGKGLGMMDGTDEENDSTRFPLEEKQKEKKRTTRSEPVEMSRAESWNYW